MRTSSDVYVNLRDFTDDIHELLPKNFILNYLILSKYSLDCHITERSQSFSQNDWLKAPGSVCLMQYLVRHLNSRKLETSKISPVVRDLVFSFVSSMKIPLDALHSGNVNL